MSDPTAPTNFGSVHPYGADQPAAAGAMLNKGVNAPEDEVLFQGMVTDCSTQSHSCTVTVPLKTAGAGIPCLWATGGINRFGGCSDYCPPEVGSTVFVYLPKGSNFGLVLGQVPTLANDPELPGGGMIDPGQAVTAFLEDTGQVMKDMQIGGSALNGYQGMPNDSFPGDRGLMNELGVGLNILRTIAQFKGSDLAKVEAFLADDLLRVTARNLDVYFGGGLIEARDEQGYLTTELYHALTSWESLGILKEGEEEIVTRPIWRLRQMTGYFADLKRQFISFPMEAIDESIIPGGVSDVLEGSDGFLIDRTVTGGGIVKSRQVGVPERVRRPEDIAGGQDTNRLPPDAEDLSDFWWQYATHGNVIPQMRDALAWIIGRQSTARLKPYDQGGENPDWDLQDEADVGFGKGNGGADTAEGGHNRDLLDQVILNELDVNNGTTPRVIRVNDSWIFILPDGSITVRDGLGTAVTLTRGHVDISSSKDVNITAGRNVNIKAGHDINLNARRSIDVTAGEGQARIYARKSAFLHSEEGGIMLTTNSAGGKSEIDMLGERFESGGIILKPHTDADTVVETRSMYVQARNSVLIGGQGGDRPVIYFEAEEMKHKIDQANWQLTGGKYVQFIGGGTTIDTDGTINTEADVQALFGTMRMNSTHEEHKDYDFCNSPGDGYKILIDRLQPGYENEKASGGRSKAKRNPPRGKCGQDRDDSDASNDGIFNWQDLHGVWNRAEIGRLEFSLRTEEDYGSEVDDFSWTEQPWMREWTGAAPWGEDAKTVSAFGETWCYPGTKYWTGETGFTTYDEANVNPSGDPKKRDELVKEGGEFKQTNFQNMKRHP